MAVMSQKTKGRLVLLGIVMVFLVPIGVAQWWVQHVQQRLEEGNAVRLSALHSDFLGPVRLGQWFPQDVAPDVLQRGTWTLLVWAPQSCTEACLRTVALTQRMQIALGRYAWRVQRVLMTPQPPQGSLEPYGRFESLIVPQAKGSGGLSGGWAGSAGLALSTGHRDGWFHGGCAPSGGAFQMITARMTWGR